MLGNPAHHSVTLLFTAPSPSTCSVPHAVPGVERPDRDRRLPGAPREESGSPAGSETKLASLCEKLAWRPRDRKEDLGARLWVEAPTARLLLAGTGASGTVQGLRGGERHRSRRGPQGHGSCS